MGRCLGNHDYGGADFICNSGDSPAKYSSNDGRRVLKDHFYVYTIEDSTSGVSIDVFNVDSGDDDLHVGMDKWLNIINNTGVHLWLNGHTHGENHDSSSSLGVHFVDNELAEVSKKESASGIPTHAEEYVDNLWT
ncbi:Metallo-dependent phosphatase-like [Phytophthora cactorum]|nr:Metallo-dependent phosphatase-like [Phytophthora cactorum]